MEHMIDPCRRNSCHGYRELLTCSFGAVPDSAFRFIHDDLHQCISPPMFVCFSSLHIQLLSWTFFSVFLQSYCEKKVLSLKFPGYSLTRVITFIHLLWLHVAKTTKSVYLLPVKWGKINFSVSPLWVILLLYFCNWGHRQIPNKYFIGINNSICFLFLGGTGVTCSASSAGLSHIPDTSEYIFSAEH